MLISLKWLREYIDLEENIDINELENALTMIGQEVEKISIQGHNLEKVVTAKIIDYKMHPNSDHLTICKVDNGKEILQIVCGASNHKQGDVVVLAQVGAKLSEDFVIKKGAIRGETSEGMLCSEVELNIGDDNSGIIILPQDTPVGISAKEYFGLDDIVFELEITPNRPDCLSHIGIARELSCYYNKDLKLPYSKVSSNIKNDFKINIEDNTSNKYIARIIKNVKIEKSPKWLKERLEAVEVKSINSIVDISNYVMLETNQPNHMFDLSKISGKNITIKRSSDKFTTLDDIERTLENDIVVCDEEKIIALAGVMGGANTEITDNTTDILIEVAHFDNISIRHTSRRLGLISESSYRFEREVDTNNMERVMDRLTSLILSLNPEAVVSDIVSSKVHEEKIEKTTLSIDRMNRFIGKEIPLDRVFNIFKKLEIEVEQLGENLVLTPPSHRSDLKNQFDYFEEVIRMYGFDNIENTLPKLPTNRERIVNTIKFTQDIKKIVSSIGLNEVINYSFVPINSQEKVRNIETEYETILLQNPIIEDFTKLRTTLLYSLLKNTKDNFNRNQKNIRIFEVSKTFKKEKNEKLQDNVKIDDFAVIEEQMLSILLAGKTKKDIWNQSTEYDFYDMKGILEHLFNKIKFNSYKLTRSNNPIFHPNKSADIYVGRELIGSFGELHPDTCENMQLEDEKIYFSEISLDKLKKYIRGNIKYISISQYPSVNRDMSFIINKNVNVGDILNTITKTDKLIESINLFDIYQGEGIDDNQKSISLNIVIRDKNKTLIDKEILEVMQKIENRLIKEYGIVMR